VCRQYILLKMMKRAARGHDPAGSEVTPPGALALDCPACPQPGKNMSLVRIKSITPSKKYVAALHYLCHHLTLPYSFLERMRLSIDGCFKMKQRERGITDTDMDTGGAYFVEDTRYRQYLKETKKNDEKVRARRLTDQPSH
jgi:hypothetical protein